jgi:hypothetical protein
MTALATESGSKLAPFRQIYGEHSTALMTDAFFSTAKQRGTIRATELAELSMPKVIPMPDRSNFDAALARWLDDITFDSLPDQMKEHDSFGELIRDGKRVVPLIAASLRRSPSFLFLALEEIFGKDPIPEEAYGNIKSTVSSWLQWLQR